MKYCCFALVKKKKGYFVAGQKSMFVKSDTIS